MKVSPAILRMKCQVYPEHCNFYQVDGKLMMHGAEVLKIADRQSAILCKDVLSVTDLIPLTVGVDKCQFLHGPLLGDLLEVSTKLIRLGRHSLKVECTMRNHIGKCFSGIFSFCSFDSQSYKMLPHGLTMA